MGMGMKQLLGILLLTPYFVYPFVNNTLSAIVAYERETNQEDVLRNKR